MISDSSRIRKTFVWTFYRKFELGKRLSETPCLDKLAHVHCKLKVGIRRSMKMSDMCQSISR